MESIASLIDSKMKSFKSGDGVIKDGLKIDVGLVNAEDCDSNGCEESGHQPTGRSSKAATADTSSEQRRGMEIASEAGHGRAELFLDADGAYQLSEPGTSCVLELHCVCEERDAENSRPVVTERYRSKLIRNTDSSSADPAAPNGSPDRGPHARRRSDGGGGETKRQAITISCTRYEERESRSTSRTGGGQVLAEKAVRTEKSHEATTLTYQLVDDQVVKRTLRRTRRRSSISSASTETSDNMAAAGKTKDKYIVSFNSDTSDSEEEESGDELKTPATNKEVASKPSGATDHSNSNSKNSNTTTAKVTKAVDPESAPSAKQKVISADLDQNFNAPIDGSTKRKNEPKTHPNGPIVDLMSSDVIPPSTDNGPRKSDTSRFKADTATDILVDLSGSTPEVSTTISQKPTGSIVSPELEGLSLSFSPKLQSGEKESGDKDVDSRINKRFEKRRTRPGALLNGTNDNNIKTFDVLDDDVFAVENKHKTDILDADILIYASPGGATKKFDFDLDTKRDIEYRKSKSFDGDMTSADRPFRSGKFERQSSKPEERTSSSKGKYDDLDEKFSAICSKYGKETKRERLARTSSDLGPGQQLCGVVRVKTGAQNGDSNEKQTEPGHVSPQQQGINKHGADLDPEASAPRQKITFDDMVKWDKSSTDELIKRILADAHDSADNNFGRRKANETISSEKSRDTVSTWRRLPEPYEKEMGGGRPYGSQTEESPSLLERRLASLAGGEKSNGSNPCTTMSTYDPYCTQPDDEPEQLYKRKSRGQRLGESDDDTWSVDSVGSGRYIPWRQRQKAADYRDDSLSLAIPSRYDDTDSDNDSYVSRREMAPVLPDDYFKPEKSEETDAVVRERTSEVRTMVDNQAEVLGRLKKAADSFDELEAEIRQLKKEVLENHVARQTIIEDIIADIKENAVIATDEEAPLVVHPQRYSRSSLQRSDSYYTSGYSSLYGTRYGRSRDTESCSRLDTDLESDKLGGYALGAVAKSKWGEPGGSRAFRSASVCRFDDVEDEKYDKYGLYNTLSASKRWSTSADGWEAKSDYGIEAGDDAETASIRSYPSEKSSDDRSDDAESGAGSRYRSRYALSKLSGREPDGRYAGLTSSTLSYSSSSRPSRSSLHRSHTVNTGDYKYDRPRVRAGSVPPPDSKPFTSRFLSKVREKRASGDYTKPSRDKPFRSRFLARSFDSDYYSASSSSRGSLASTPDSPSPRSLKSRDNDVSASTTAKEASEETAN